MKKPPFLDCTEFTLGEAEAAFRYLDELRCTEEECALVEKFAGRLSLESAGIWRGLLAAKKSSGEMAIWLRGCLCAAAKEIDAAIGHWADLQWTVEGEGRATVMLALAGALIKSGRLEEAWQPLSSAARCATSARSLRRVDRLLRDAAGSGAAIPSKRQCKVALAASFTIDLLAPLFRARCWGSGIDAKLYIAPFDQIAQEIENPESGLSRFRPDVVVIAPDWRWLGFAEDEPDPDAALQERLAQLERLGRACRDRLAAFVVQFGFEVPLDEPWGRLGMALPGGRSRLIQRLNLALWEAASNFPGTAILDLEQVSSSYGKQRWSDPVLWQVARQYPAPEALVPLSHELAAVLRAIYGLAAKCIVLDLDGTLWGGVIGEDGLGGIQLGGSPAGESFASFQRYLKVLSRQGILLAVCSKNNEEDARRPFRDHPEMVLRESDIACFVANWRPKHENIAAIAKAINIGTDSLVYVDDNPVERAAIRRRLPEVEVVEMPSEPARYISALSQPKHFETLSLTEEDRLRTHSIRGNIEREQMSAAAGDVGEYLAGLGIRVELAPFDEANLPRITQLINKTNQFNLTTRRRTEPEVRSLISSRVYTQAMRVSDRFGDQGLTGVLIAVPEGNTLRVDSWLMSCRVMGRKLEEAMFSSLTVFAKDQGFESVLGEYIPTAKNSVVADLFVRLGCASVGQGEGSQLYRWNGGSPAPSPDVLQVNDLTMRNSPALRA